MFLGVRRTIIRLRNAVRPMRDRGLDLASIALLHLPAATFLRAWQRLARPLNGGRLQAINERRFSAFAAGLPDDGRPRFYVIVMPNVLHFLLPCVALLERDARVVLLVNGAHRWERSFLAAHLGGLPCFRLWTLPLSSAEHGHVISMLLRNNPGSFGIVDHDCYVFDRGLFGKLAFPAKESLLGLFQESRAADGFTYPLTFFLFFNAEILRSVMARHGIDARLYRTMPPQVTATSRRAGLAPANPWKSHHSFFDTLHVLLAAALADGHEFRFLSSQLPQPAMHIGGTSIGSHHTKDLFNKYVTLRFLEFLGNPLLSRRYAFLTAPLRTSQEVLRAFAPSHPVWRALPVIDTLIRRLHEDLGHGKCAGSGP